ncbi:DUF5690 family protein [Chitinophaga sp. 30R24]|uniref:DUF5690 family protein n=1 Tax=Chitinophaga sp. 30R24 TaxID=3248838 RepID=UPI003B9180E1
MDTFLCKYRENAAYIVITTTTYMTEDIIIQISFVNGPPLRMIWGLVFSYLEGRRSTELMGAVLSISFIFSSGFVKSVEKMAIVNWGITAYLKAI